MPKTIKKVKEELEEARKIQDPTKKRKIIIEIKPQWFRLEDSLIVQTKLKELVNAGVIYLDVHSE